MAAEVTGQLREQLRGGPCRVFTSHLGVRVESGKRRSTSDNPSGWPKATAAPTTLYPVGKERMRRLTELVRTQRLDRTPLLTHSFELTDIAEAYSLFGDRREGLIKVAIRP